MRTPLIGRREHCVLLRSLPCGGPAAGRGWSQHKGTHSMSIFQAQHSLSMTMVVAALAHLGQKNAHVGPEDLATLDFVERLAVETRHHGLLEMVLQHRRALKRDALVVRRRASIDDAVESRMGGDAAAAAAAMAAADAADADLAKLDAEMGKAKVAL